MKSKRVFCLILALLLIVSQGLRATSFCDFLYNNRSRIAVISGFAVAAVLGLYYCLGGSQDGGSPRRLQRNIASVITNNIEIQKKQGNIVDPFESYNNDETYAIVNAANPQLMNGGGVAGAIFSAAGSKLDQACGCHRPPRGSLLRSSTVVVTESGNLYNTNKKISKVIHAVAPNFNRAHGLYGRSYIFDFNARGKKLLADTYANVLDVAEQNGVHNVAIPFLSGGNFKPSQRGVEKELAKIAVKTVIESCKRNRFTNLKKVIFVLYDRDTVSLFSDVLVELQKKEG